MILVTGGALMYGACRVRFLHIFPTVASLWHCAASGSSTSLANTPAIYKFTVKVLILVTRQPGDWLDESFP